MKGIAVDTLLVVGVIAQLGACLGILRMRSGYDRLHYAAAATTIGPVAIATAVVLDAALSEPGMKAVFTAITLLTGGALLTHATGRAGRIRDDGGWRIHRDEREGAPR